MILDLAWMVLIGLLIGALAKLVMPGKDPSPWWVTSLIGIGGALLAGFVGRAFGHGGSPGLIGSFIGAVLIVWVWRMARGRTIAKS
jgi:uncharacterized membrane protein YeaQ/YmgE (transglycosylase-associated protein family)